tara:strand:- start:10564 stop:12033 length:1470 start_codon:yes stop_codon:yes gene_type:complete
VTSKPPYITPASSEEVSNTNPDLISVHEFAPAEVSEIDLYQKREKIYTRKIEGLFQRLRMFTGWPLLMGYLLLPWLQWGDRQAVLFDLPARKFHILGLTFWPQDMSMLGWVLIIAAFGLFAVTNFAGRVWCGYTCPQTVWTSIFMWIEQRVEGSRNQRIKLDKAPWTPSKALKKFLKHGMWLGFAFLTGFTFVGYFTPIDELGYGLFSLSVSAWAGVWIFIFTLLTYLNAGWMREQVCMHMCPYARFQSAMFDRDTLIISYDSARGDPRGSRKRNETSAEVGLGDCIDCQLCVQVCPTGIDIRNGLQYECIGCALCVDACNSVMAKMNYPKGLISYTTENALSGKPLRIIRPRLVGYVIAVLIMCSLLGYRMITRDTLVLSVLRDRQALYFQSVDGLIENRYTLRIANKTEQDHDYQLRINSTAELQLRGSKALRVESGEVRELNIQLLAEPGSLKTPSVAVSFIAAATDNLDKTVTVESRFIAPGSEH